MEVTECTPRKPTHHDPHVTKGSTARLRQDTAPYVTKSRWYGKATVHRNKLTQNSKLHHLSDHIAR